MAQLINEIEQTPQTTEEVVEYLQRVMPQIAQGLRLFDDSLLNKTHVAPDKTEDGMVRYADGSDWNPGEGAGYYYHDGSNWIKLAVGADAPASHAASHITSGSDEIDGDKLDIDWTPSNYTPSTSPSEADSVDNLTAHLAGIDTVLGTAATGLPLNYLSGLGLSLDTDTEHDILVAVGECRGAADDGDMILGTVFTKQINLDWAEGDDGGGLASGARSLADTPNVDTWYHFFVVGKSADSSAVDGGFDTSIVATNLLSDASTYDLYRRIGAVLVDGSSNILGFSMFRYPSGLTEVLWDDPPVDQYDTTIGTTHKNYTLSTPLGVQVMAIIRTAANPGQAYVITLNSIDHDDETVTDIGATGPLSDLRGSTGGRNTMQVRTNTSSEIRAVSNNASADVAIATLGWLE